MKIMINMKNMKIMKNYENYKNVENCENYENYENYYVFPGSWNKFICFLIMNDPVYKLILSPNYKDN